MEFIFVHVSNANVLMCALTEYWEDGGFRFAHPCWSIDENVRSRDLRLNPYTNLTAFHRGQACLDLVLM